MLVSKKHLNEILVNRVNGTVSRIFLVCKKDCDTVAQLVFHHDGHIVLHLIEAVAIARNHNRHIGTAGKLPIVSVKKMREVVKAADSGII